MFYRLRFVALPALVVAQLSCSGDGADTAPIDKNAAPAAEDVAVAVDEDNPIAVDLSGADADGDELTYTVASDPAHGTLSGTAPKLTYTPEADFNGSDTFTYRVNDGQADSAIATATITVNPVNDAPVVEDLAQATGASTPLEITLTAKDVDADDTLTFAVLEGPEKGELTGEAPNLVYTPGPDVKGEFSFTYQANDGTTDSNIATVTIAVAEGDEPPTADNLAVETKEDEPLEITLTGADPESETVTFTVAEDPQGTLTGTAPALTYTPPQDFNGEDTFTYRTNDGGLDSALATVTITVTPVGDAPAASDDALTVGNGATGTELDGGATSLLDNDSDPDGDALTVTTTPVIAPVNGALVLNADGTFSYTHDRTATTSDSFEYEICDDSSDAACATATVSVVIRPNVPPVVASVAITPADPREGNVLTCTLGDVADVDGDNVTVTYAWTVNDEPLDGAVAATLGDANWVKGDVIVCAVLPNDGKEDGQPTVSPEVTILNTGPVVSTVTVSGTPKIGEALTCSDSGYSDIDSDDDSGQRSYAWTVNGNPAGTGNTLTGGFVRGDDVICIVTASDGFNFGAGVSSDALTIVNTVPAIGTVSVTPTSIGVEAQLTCGYSGYADADSDPDLSTFEWFVNGDSVGTGNRLRNAFKRGDTVVCTVTPFDGLGSGTPVSSDGTTAIVNSPPRAPGVKIIPPFIDEGVDIVKCNVFGPSLDPDGDAVTYTVAWEADGLVYPDAYLEAVGPSKEWWDGDTVPPEDTRLAADWKCTVTPSDGNLDGPVGIALATSAEQPGPLTAGANATGGFKVLSDASFWAQPVTLASESTVSAFGINMASDSKVILGLYTDAGGKPGTKLLETAFVPVSVGITSIDVTNPSLVAAGNYFIVANFENGASPTIVASPNPPTTSHIWSDGAVETLPDAVTSTVPIPGDQLLAWWLIGL